MGLDLEGKNDDSVFTLRRRQRRWKPVLQGVRCTIDGGDGGDGTAGRCGTGDACVHDAAADFGFTGSSIGTGSSISAVSGAAAATGTDDRDAPPVPAPAVPAAPGTAYQQQPQMAGYQQQPYRAQTYPQQPVDSQQYGQYQQPGVPGVPMAPVAPVAQKKSKKPLIIVLAIIIVAALVTGGVFLFLHLSQPGVNGTYSLSAGGNTGTLSVDGKKMSLDLPGNDDGKPAVSATIDKVTSGNGSHSYTLKDLKFSGASGNYVMSEVTGLIGYIGGLGEEQDTAVLNALSPTVTIPDGASKGEPNGTWSVSCSVMGLGMGISANFKDDGTLTMSVQATGHGESTLHGTWSKTGDATFDVSLDDPDMTMTLSLKK